ncbi:MAG: hypothetical protein KQI78_25745 [Deltaproteobacteria bacterium]|nr:hypothetical protein [Deltaproteobacteria bacterium]
MSGYVIVVSPSEPGFSAQTFPVDAPGLLSVIALLEDEPETMLVRVTALSLNVRRTPAGEVVGSVSQGAQLTVYLPTEPAQLGGHPYEWGHITAPLNGWVALGDGLTEEISENKRKE